MRSILIIYFFLFDKKTLNAQTTTGARLPNQFLDAHQKKSHMAWPQRLTWLDNWLRKFQTAESETRRFPWKHGMETVLYLRIVLCDIPKKLNPQLGRKRSYHYHSVIDGFPKSSP